MIEWLLHSLVVSALLCLAALSVERALHLYRLPTRFVWAAALLLAPSIPAVIRLAGPVPVLPTGFITLPGIVVGAGEAIAGTSGKASGSSGLSADPASALVLIWLVVSLVLAARIGASLLRLRRARAGWTRREIDGIEVLLSGDVGPAVAGLLRGAILIPDWVLDLEPGRRRLVVAHEYEHLRAGDHRTLAVGLAVCVALPWNLPLWWALARLRLATELDCDRRVLDRWRDPHRYGSLLLEVGQRGAMPGLAPAALSEGARQLEQRVRAMTAAIPRYRAVRAALAGALAAALVVTACGTPKSPAGSTPPETAVALEASANRAQQIAKLTGVVVDAESGRPLNGVLVFLENTGIGANTAENGRYFLVNVPPGTYLLRAEKTGYSPETVEVEVESGRTVEVDLELNRASEGGPVFTPFTARPTFVDPQRAGAIVSQHYPDSLEASGVGGTVTLWLYVNKAGEVEEVRIQSSSGVPALDQAALDAAREFQFSPARNRDRIVSVWVAIPITFSPRQP